MTASAPIRVLIADDHPVVRQGMAALLSAEPGITVIAQVGDGEALVLTALAELPDVAVVDLTMPRLHGVDAIARLRNECKDVRVLVLSMHDADDVVRSAVRAGANGFLVKGADLGDLVSAVRAVAGGGAYFSPAAARALLTSVRAKPVEVDALTDREREVLRRVAAGQTSSEIGQALGIGQKTVEAHRARIMDKLGVRDVAGLVRWAIRAGIAPLEP
jgi:DNA-binding NarL/FixJ family response regulator